MAWTTKKLAAVLTAANLAVGVVGSIIGTSWKAEAKVAEVSERVVRDQWLTTLESETKRIASEAAEHAAERAVAQVLKDEVLPLDKRFDSHVAASNEVQRSNERLTRLEVRDGLWSAPAPVPGR
jgi:isocitrate/isopropylmalate dehydrogenase